MGLFGKIKRAVKRAKEERGMKANVKHFTKKSKKSK